MTRSFAVLLLLLFLAVLTPSMAEIKNLKISDDSRELILFEKFGFTRSGAVIISLSDVSFTSPDPSLLGFFLLSDESLLQAAYDSEQQAEHPDAARNPNAAVSCVLQSPYVKSLFSLAQVQPSASYNHTFPITHPDEYSLFFANCAPETKVSMTVVTEMYNARPDGRLDFLSVGQSPVPSLYFFFAVAYFSFFAIWIYLSFYKNRLDAHRIHHLMAGLLLTKALNLLFAAEDQHYIR